ncbi:TonB-dependent receptor [Pedobacter sp. MC2016-14]|uniref:TonB-dependent receptor n=1 Tax=Pedobacter sp. MC2016-14 TaxID=2897327 RepID=UPI001E588A4E|nr:TonB-dependent receptor [Pedobacter sp. MC2016-14]MCD0486628.1 TonB-dependent receptor [Pedobacter sp. MC2016-14]
MKSKFISIAIYAMKFSIYQLIVITVCTCGAIAKNAEAQGLLDKKVSLKAEQQNIKTIIEMVEQLTEVKFVYSTKSINAFRKASIQADREKLNCFLNKLLSPYAIGYKVINDRILLYAESDAAIQQASNPIYEDVITGKVSDSKGNALPGVSVAIKGSTNGTLTDANGQFSLKVTSVGNYIVTFTYVGYITKEVTVDVTEANKPISISLSEDALQLDGVVVTGGGNPKKKLESSVALTSVSNKDIANRAPLNSTDLLKAIPGLTVESTGGDGPGNVWVRGFPQQGGYIFLGIQEDGLPLLPTGFNTNPSVDQYYKTDLTIQNIEAIRGGNASIVQANTPGAVINNISYSGADKAYGQFKFTTGLSQGLYRVDGNTGGKLSEHVRFNIGGFYRTDNGVVDQGFSPANQGGQIKGNMTFNFKNNKGFIRVYGKYLNDKVQFLLTSYYPYDGTGKPTTYRDYDMASQSIVPLQTEWSYNDPAGTAHNFSLTDGIHTKLGSGGFQFNYATDAGWQIVNNFRYQNTHTNSTYTVPSGIAARTSATPYYYPGGAVAPFVAGDQVITSSANGQINSDMQIVNYVDFRKTVRNHSISIGGGIHQYNRDDIRYAFRSFSEFKEHPSILLQSPTAAERTIQTKNTFIGHTRTLSLYASDEIKLSEQWRLDIGARVDNQNVKGDRPYYALNTSGAPVITASATPNILGYTAYNETLTNWAASVGANYKISSSTSMFARVTKAYNAPNIGDYNASAYNAANIKKRPVYLAEIGYKYAKNNLAIFASGSYSAIKNTSLTINVPTIAAGTQALVAFGSTRTFSAEYEVSYKIAKPLSLRLTGTLQDSKYTDYEASTSGNAAVQAQYGDRVYSFTGKRTERVPVLNTELGANYDYKNFNLYVAANYVGSRFTSPSDSYRLPAYMVMKAGAGYNFTKRVAVRFWADNILNAKVLTEGDVRGDQFRDFSAVTPGTLMIGRTLLQRTYWGSLAYSF